MKKMMAFLFLPALLFTSCDQGRCIRGNKDLITETRSTPGFSGLVSKGSLDVRVISSDTREIRIDAESNLLPYIQTFVDDGDLIIKVRENRCLMENYTIQVTVYTPDIERLRLDGSGDIEADRLSGNRVEVSLSGSGDIKTGIDARYLNTYLSGSGRITLHGITRESDMKISGSGDIKAYELVQETCFATISGSGNMYLNVSKLLDVSITGSGDVYYRGNPTINSRITGSGKVYHTW